MVASTWFQGSIWPPGYQGMLPSSICPRTMASTVASRSDTSSALSASGSSTPGPPRLLQVDHQALADERVQGSFQPARDRRTVGHVPDQEAVIETGQRRIVAPD